jgi:hypothetical protein
MLAGELNGGFQEGQSDAGSPVTTVYGEASDPPNSSIILGEHSCQSLVALDAWERRTRSYSGPSGGIIIDIGDEPRRHVRAGDLLVQRGAVVRRRFGNRGFRCFGAEEEPAPAPRRVLAAPTKYRDQVAPAIRSRGTDIDGHNFHHRVGSRQGWQAYPGSSEPSPQSDNLIGPRRWDQMGPRSWPDGRVIRGLGRGRQWGRRCSQPHWQSVAPAVRASAC